jgi:ElaB/YqjD/DUF883 family membrane-anchored ribosome-binding protein
MVTRAYLLDRKSPPRSVKLTVDQVLIPAAIDAAGQIEAVAEYVSNTVKARPWTVLGIVAGVALLLGSRK